MKRKLETIVDVLDDFGLMEQPIGKRMVLVATMGSTLRPNEVYVAYEELTDLIAHELKVVMWIGSWPLHIRECVERYELAWFGTVANCEAFYYNYLSFYLQVQKLAESQTTKRLR